MIANILISKKLEALLASSKEDAVVLERLHDSLKQLRQGVQVTSISDGAQRQLQQLYPWGKMCWIVSLAIAS